MALHDKYYCYPQFHFQDEETEAWGRLSDLPRAALG